MKHATLLSLLCAIGVTTAATPPEAARPPQQIRIFNTVKQKLAEGRQVVGGTVSTADPEVYCAMANSGFDFIWIEMQHSH